MENHIKNIRNNAHKIAYDFFRRNNEKIYFDRLKEYDITICKTSSNMVFNIDEDLFASILIKSIIYWDEWDILYIDMSVTNKYVDTQYKSSRIGVVNTPEGTTLRLVYYNLHYDHDINNKECDLYITKKSLMENISDDFTQNIWNKKSVVSLESQGMLFSIDPVDNVLPFSYYSLGIIVGLIVIVLYSNRRSYS